MTYPIIQIPQDAADSPEFMGTKWKQWVLHEGERWLFKEARATAGEDWSEKVASEIGKLLGIDVADVELAQFGERRGCILRNFVHRDRGEVLWHGNEILAGNIKDYDKEKKLRQHQHNLKNIWLGLERVFQDMSREIIDQVHQDMGLRLVLDALIGNTDRHHENWGLLWYTETQPDGHVMMHLRMAPSFDHASSLGRELLDERRQSLMVSRQVGGYVRRGHGAVYISGAESRCPCPLAVAEKAAADMPEHFRAILAKVQALDMAKVREVLQQVPDERISAVTREFAAAMIEFSKQEMGRIAV